MAADRRAGPAHRPQAGFTLRERLTIYPEYVRAGDARGSTRACAARDRAGRPGDRAGRRGGPPGGPALAGAGRRSFGGPDRPARDHRHDRAHRRPARRLRHASTATGPRWPARPTPPAAPAGRRGADATTCVAGLRLAADDPAALLEPRHEAAALALFDADGPALDELCRLADDVRRDAVGDDVTYVVNRNINFTNVCYVGCRFCAFAQRERDADAYRLSLEQVADRAEEAWAAGATEVCMQGGIDPKLPVTAYADLVRAIKARVPGMHVHAFSPMEIVTGAAKAGVSIRDWLTELREAGLDTIPGTAAEILDDDVRWVLTKGKLPAAAWVEVVEHGARAGHPVQLHDDVRPRRPPAASGWATSGCWPASRTAPAASPSSWRCRSCTPTRRSTWPASPGPGPTWRENRVGARDGPAAAARPDRQHPVLLGEARRRGHRGDAQRRLQRPGRHADGGDHLPDGRLGHGSARTVEQLRAIAAAAGRPARERTTTYGHARA